jgi:hypothetical protein
MADTSKVDDPQYDPLDDFDVEKAEVIGFGLEALDAYIAEKRSRTIVLDKDVAARFPTSDDVNSALRVLMRAAEDAQPQAKKTA